MADPVEIWPAFFLITLARTRKLDYCNFEMKTWTRIGIVLFASLAIAGCSKTGDNLSKSNSGKEGKAASSEKESAGKPKGVKVEKESKSERIERAQRERPAVPVKVVIVDEGAITSSLVFDSVLETESSVEIFAESSGVILEVLVEEGDSVTTGQVLARLENDVQQVDLDETKARYEHEKMNFQRRIDLYERKLINQQDFETAKFALEQARLRYERSNIQLENTIVRSTLDGVVTERIAQTGRRVTANRQLFSIINLDELFATVNIPGQHLLRIEKGLPAIIDSELIEGVRYDAFVKLVSPIVDPGSGTFRAKVAVKSKNGMPIYPGMFVNVRVIVDTSDNAVLVSKEAIVHEGDLKYFFKVQAGRAKKVLLQEGYSNVEFIQATSGIEKGDSVIVMGQSALKDGANVKVVTEAASAEQSDSDADGTTNG